MPPRGFQRTQIPNEIPTLRGLKPSPTGKLGFLVITHVLCYTHLHETAHDLWRSKRRPKGGGTWVERWGQDSVCRNWVNVQRHPSTQLMCTETPYLHSLCLEMPGVWTRGENLIRKRKKRGRRRRRNPSVKICASCIKNAGEAWFEFKERKAVAALWFCLECKQGFKGALFRRMFPFGLWNLGSPTVGDISQHKLCMNGTDLELQLDFHARLAQPRAPIRQENISRARKSVLPEYFSFSGPPKVHWEILD